MCVHVHHGCGVGNIRQSVTSDQPSEERCTLNYETQGTSRPDTGFIEAWFMLLYAICCAVMYKKPSSTGSEGSESHCFAPCNHGFDEFHTFPQSLVSQRVHDNRQTLRCFWHFHPDTKQPRARPPLAHRLAWSANMNEHLEKADAISRVLDALAQTRSSSLSFHNPLSTL